MDNIQDSLKTIKVSNKKYIFILAYFIAFYSVFILYEISIIYHILFILGIVGFTFAYEKIERELARVKMKNFYTKAKLSYRIKEIDESIKKDKNEFEKEMLQKVLDEIDI